VLLQYAEIAAQRGKARERPNGQYNVTLTDGSPSMRPCAVPALRGKNMPVYEPVVTTISGVTVTPRDVA
jgi:hypothetical protein